MSTAAPLPRIRSIDRNRCSSVSLEQQLPADHPVRAIWAFVQLFDWTPWYGRIRAVEGRPGAPAVAPELLFALWLFATTEGVASCRELNERCGRDLPYQWLCGGEPVNYWTLNDFYTAHAADLDRLFVEHIAALRGQGLIALRRVTQDGRKVVADAGKDTFHRQGTLERHWAEAEQHVAAVQAQRARRRRAAGRKRPRSGRRTSGCNACGGRRPRCGNGRSSVASPSVRTRKRPRHGRRKAIRTRLG